MNQPLGGGGDWGPDGEGVFLEPEGEGGTGNAIAVLIKGRGARKVGGIAERRTLSAAMGGRSGFIKSGGQLLTD